MNTHSLAVTTFGFLLAFLTLVTMSCPAVAPPVLPSGL